MKTFDKNLHALQNTYKHYGLKTDDVYKALCVSKAQFYKFLDGEEMSNGFVKKVLENGESKLVTTYKKRSLKERVLKLDEAMFNRNPELLVEFCQGNIMAPDIMSMLKASLGQEKFEENFANKFMVTNRAIAGLLDFYLIKNGEAAMEIMVRHGLFFKHKKHGYIVSKLVFSNTDFSRLCADLERLPVVLDMDSEEDMGLVEDRYLYLNQDLYYAIANKAKNPIGRIREAKKNSYLYETGTKYSSTKGDFEFISGSNYYTIERVYDSHEEFRSNGHEFYCKHLVFALRGIFGYNKRDQIKVIHPKEDCVLHNPSIKSCKYRINRESGPIRKLNNWFSEEETKATDMWYDELIAREKLRDLTTPFTIPNITKL